MSINIISSKKVIQTRSKAKRLPKILPPMERPDTPRNDIQFTISQNEKEMQNLSFSHSSYLNEEGSSIFEEIKERFENAKNSDDILNAVLSFELAAQNLSDSKSISICDMIEYNKLHPRLNKLIKTCSDCINHFVSALTYILKALKDFKATKPKEPSMPKTEKTSNRLNKYEPLPPLSSEPKTKISSMSNAEYTNNIILKLLYTISQNEANYKIFLNKDLIEIIISLSNPSHETSVRLLSIAIIGQETQNKNFRNFLTKLPSYTDLLDTFESTTDNSKLLIQSSNLIRNLINDIENIDLIVEHNIHIFLFKSLLKFTDNAKYCYTCFSIFTIISEMDEVQQSLFEKFTENTILTLFYTLFDKYKKDCKILSRISFVFGGFTSQGISFIEKAGQIKEPYNIIVIKNSLETKEVTRDTITMAYIIQVIANLSVDKNCSSILSSGKTIQKMFKGRTFDKSDRLGYNLLCAASNFTFHDHSWSSKELLDSIPIAIVSNHVPSIIEALRILCNLALEENAMLINSKIFELLTILIKHVNQDVVLYALQALANLIKYDEIKKRFRSTDLIESLLELLNGDILGDSELEAITALIMNFGKLTVEESRQFYDAFDVTQNAEIPDVLKDLLNQ